jgi:hypothetical protein
MSTRYIPQLNETNFVFPNYEISEYDVDIIHSLNENSISGTVSNFSAITISSTSILLTYNYTWSQNGAETFIKNINNISNIMPILSIHVLAAGQTYYKPWRLVDVITEPPPYSISYSGFSSITITPSQMGLTTFVTGTYYFEFRFIGLKSIYPVCQTLSITVP